MSTWCSIMRGWFMAVAGGVYAFGGFAQTEDIKKESQLDALTYVTFNIGGGAPSAFGFHQPFDLQRAGNYLKSLNADFVALQEVDRFVGRNGNPKRDTAAELAKMAGFPHVLYGKAMPLRGGEYGIALLAKMKPETWRVIPLPGEGEPRVFIDARFRLADGHTVSVCATHLGFPSVVRQSQVRAIIAYYQENPVDGILLAGDLNAETGSPELKILKKVFTLVTPEPGQMTWLGGGKAIDHFLVWACRSGSWKVLSETRRLPYTTQKPLSDHMPVLLRVRWMPAS